MNNLQIGDRLWNGAIVTAELAAAYNSATQRIEAFEAAGRPAPVEIVNGRFHLLQSPR